MFFRRILFTPNFFVVFAENLDKIFPSGWVYKEGQEDVFCAVDGTTGWETALIATCTELNIYDAYEYWRSLEWHECDILDSYIGELLCACVYDDNGNRVKK